MTAHGASCLGCGHPQVTDWFLDRMTADVPVRGRTVDPVAIKAAVERIEEHAQAERVAYFSGPVEQPPAISAAYARHEAAHAVVGILVGLTVTAVNVASTVMCTYAPGPPGIGERAQVIALLAGDAVRLTWAGVRCWPHNRQFCAGRATERAPDFRCDTCLIFRAIAEADPSAGPAGWQETFSARLDAAIRILRRPSIERAVQAVADELVAKGRLDGATVHAMVERIVSPADRNRLFPET